MEKHIKIVHENVKLYCTYFNNQQECPHDQECVFLHEESEMCRYGKGCERNNCMFKHNSATSEDAADDEDNEMDELIVNVVENEKDEVNDIEEKNDIIDIDESEETFCNPSQTEVLVDDEVRNVDVDENADPNKHDVMKCDQCNFEITDKQRFERHKFEIHSVKGKYVCSGFHEEFDTRKWFNSHNYRGCNPFTVIKVRQTC